jgi:self-protective colicin-like immunity protein
MENFTPGHAEDGAPYLDLIRSFVTGTMQAAEFETEYLRLAKGEQKLLPEQIREVTDNLFYDVDEYVEDTRLRAATGGLNDDELRAKAEVAYHRLVDAMALVRSQETSG